MSRLAPVQPFGVFADRSKQAVTHLMHHAICAALVLLMSACTQINLRLRCQPIGLSCDVRVTPAQPRRQEADALQAVVIRCRDRITQQRLHFIA